MKRLFTLLITLIFIGSISFAQNSAEVLDGVLKVKFKAERTKQLDILVEKTSSKRVLAADSKAGYVQTGIASIDKLNQKYGAVKYTRIFRDAGKNEAKHREYGLHLWYKIEYNTKAMPVELAKEFMNSADIEHANPEYKAELRSEPQTESLTGTPNDPKFSDQWHYENTGQNGGTSGDDISLLEAWTLETGSSNVIVAIEDGGVDWDHPDLAGNMWVNPGEIAGNNIDDDNNGYVDDIYGYNFADNTSTIPADDHGTHVAGTVAAETNNGIGVAGVAGGSGNNDGVRIMSCAVFAQANGGFEEAYTYAADNGAVISQNSWGYTSKGVYDQAVLDAIDYFIAEAGSSSAPMDGGIVIFAAGNDGSSGQWWPGCYDNVLAVAATNCNDERSYYSNYDTWVDVAAPGGELISTNDDPTAIHSTYPNGAYGVMQGTSMACPHVSGLAALIISRFEGNITPQQVFDRIVDNADNIDAQNPSYLGKLGSGRINAFASLGGSVVVDTEAPTTPSGLASSNVTENSVVLNWNAATDNIGVTGYDIYRNGSYLSTTSNTTSTVTGLSASTTYSFYVKAKDAAGNESGASNTVSITTGEIVAVYCDSKGNDFSYEWIAEVQVGTYSNSSNGAAYTDFTSENITLEAGSAVNVSLTPGFASSSYNEYWKIWIDYNDDKDFDDANELVFDPGSMSSSTVTGTMNILSTATGTTRMRVSMKYNAAQTACETFSYGEVEDYTVTFGAAGPDTQAPTAPTGLSSSSITETSFTLNWTASTDNVGVTGYDVYQNGSLIGSVTGTAASITGLTAATTYSYYVKAKDAEGNISAASSTLSVTTDEPADTEAPTIPSNLASSNITETAATLNWTASTDNVGVDSYDVYRNGSYLANTSSTSYTATGLTASTTYSFYVKAKDAAGNVSDASNTLSVTTGDVVAEYCTSKGSNSSYEWISNVIIGTYSNSSGAAGYTDFTSENITLEAGSSVNISLTPGFASSTYNEYWKIWIDYNNDKDFDDANELVFDSGSMSKTTVTGTINVLSTASGTTRMRVSMKYNGAQTACETFSYGEVEDYTVTFGEAIPDTEAPSVPSGLTASNITSSSATISWNASTDNVGVTGYDVFRNGTYLSSVSEASYSASGLATATTYIFTVKAKDEAGNISAASSGLSVTTLDNQVTYCASKGNNSSYEWIDLVQLNEINNTTGNNGGYADFTSMTATVSQGSSQTIYISCGFSSSSYTEFWHVWIDWDHSGTFDTDELMVSGSSSSDATLSGTFTVPSDALNGATRMRVTMKYNASATACETFTYGEVEDYTVNVSGTSSYAMTTSMFNGNVIGNESPTSVNIYPSPATTHVNVNISNGSKIGTISIYNMIGSLVKVVEINGIEREINISDLPAGSYIISVEDEKGPIVKQFIKQ